MSKAMVAEERFAWKIAVAGPKIPAFGMRIPDAPQLVPGQLAYTTAQCSSCSGCNNCSGCSHSANCSSCGNCSTPSNS